MKNWLLVLYCFLRVGGEMQGQAIDTIAIKKEVTNLIQMAQTFTQKRDFEKAFQNLKEAERLVIETFGKESVAYGTICFNFGRTYYYSENAGESEKWHLKALEIREKLLGKNHSEYAASLDNLGILYQNSGQFDKAESMYLESNHIIEARLGRDNLEFGRSLNNMGILYSMIGQFEKSLPLYFESQKIRKKYLGIESQEYAATLNNIGISYFSMGRFAEAENLYLESKKIRAKVLGKEHPSYAWSLVNLGNLYLKMGVYDDAETLYLESKAIREKLNGKETPDYASNLNNLGELYWQKGEYEKAEKLYLETKSIREKVLTKGNPEYAKTLVSLAKCCEMQGKYAEAEALLTEATKIVVSAEGENHFDNAGCLVALHSLFMKMGQLDKAVQQILEVSPIRQTYLMNAAKHLSEQELCASVQTFQETLNEEYSVKQIQKNGFENLNKIFFDNILFFKGFILYSTNETNRLSLRQNASADQFNLLKSYHRRLAGEYSQPIPIRDSVAIADLEEKANTLEKELVRTVAGYGEAIRQVNWQEVQQKLRPGEAAIEFVHYHFFNPEPTDSTMYAALVLRPGDSQPQFVPLFEEKQLQNLLSQKAKDKTEQIRSIYSFSENGLAKLIFQPLENSLSFGEGRGEASEGRGEVVKTIYFSPSGLLHRLNLGAIAISPTENLGDRFGLTGLGSTRQLVIPKNISAAQNTAMLFGGINYDMDSTAIFSANASIGFSENQGRGGGELSFAYSDSTNRGGGGWKFLSGTEKEVADIEPILQSAGIKTTVEKGFSATEEIFKTIGKNGPSPKVLHLATHGFFFPDPKTSPSKGGGRGEASAFKISDHPMIRSGLILAGGNQAWKTGKPLKPDMEDGILTAYEVSQMDLSNTELVVLSACETGLGDIQGNEGVYGLQRAFKIAGAKYLIMSLWQIPDFQTQVLMKSFYKNWLERKMEIPEAFRTAQNEMRKRYENPFFWAGFVLME